MGIEFNPVISDENTGYWEVPDDARRNPDAFELSLSSSNGLDLLETIGFTESYPEAPQPIDAFAARVTAALRKSIDAPSPEIPVHVDKAPGRVTVIDLGRDEGYINRRLYDLSMLIQKSRRIGATHISWG
jgi:hypothetical protein